MPSFKSVAQAVVNKPNKAGKDKSSSLLWVRGKISKASNLDEPTNPGADEKEQAESTPVLHTPSVETHTTEQ